MLLNLLFLTFGITVGILAVIGFFSSVRGTPIKKVCGVDGVEDEREVPGVEDPYFCRTMELVTHTSLRPGHEVEIFINGDQTYPRLWDDLRRAEVSITLQLYYNHMGRMAGTLREILLDRAQAGVRIFFLYDAFGTSIPSGYFRELREAGVRTSPFRKLELTSLHKAQHRAHNRVVVIDGCVAYTGGFGIDDKWYGSGRVKDQWRDTNVRFTGPGVLQLQAAFDACWAEATGELLTGPSFYPPDAPFPDDGGTPPGTRDGAPVGGVLHAAPTVGSTAAERFVTYTIAAARKTLYITNSYFVPDPEIRKMLRRAARRGVDVRVLTTSAETDVKSTWYAGRARYEELLRDGIRIFEYLPAMMHAKTLVADGQWASLGSMNADNRSLTINDETNLLVYDRGVAQRLTEIFLEDLTYSEEIRLDTFRRRSIPQRIAEQVCHAVWRVL